MSTLTLELNNVEPNNLLAEQNRESILATGKVSSLREQQKDQSKQHLEDVGTGT
jgi:hypothetical protein